MSNLRGENKFIDDAFAQAGSAFGGDSGRRTMAKMFHQQVLHGPDKNSTDNADPEFDKVARNVLKDIVVGTLRRLHNAMPPHRL